MGLFKKIFKPVRKVLDKVIPNEIKPALPYLAAFTPFLAPTSGILGTMTGRALLSGGANIAAQLAQEGTTEDDLNLLSAGIAAATGALSAPGAGSTIRGVDPKFIGPQTAPQGILGQGREFLAKSADFLSATRSGGVGDILRPGGTKMGFDAATATAVGVPLAQGTGDAMYTEAVLAQKQQIIDDALAAAEALEDSGARAQAIRNAMSAYDFFTEQEILDTIASAGYKAGGRVGFRFGGIDAAIDKVEDESIKESMKFASDTSDMDIPMMDLVEEFEIIFKRKPSSLDELKQFYRDFYEYKGPGDAIKFKEKIKEKMTVEAKDGGLMNLGGKEMDLRGGGFVPIGKKERADDVPARLSKNEFVMTADAVRAAGGGSVNKGAKRMYELMNNLEARV
jgi:hypothetical protein